MIAGSSLLLSLLLAFVAPDRSAERLVRQLALRDVPNLRFSDPIAVAAAPGERDLADKVLGRLRVMGMRRAFAVIDEQDARAIALDRGARWLLQVRRTTARLHLELRMVDAGLWTPPAPGIIASAQIDTAPQPPYALSQAPSPILGPDEVGPLPAPGLYGPPKAVADLPGEPLALAACPDDSPTLLVLTRSHLFRLGVEGDWTVLAQLPLGALARQPRPSRFAIGVVQCTEDRAAFGTSDLLHGHEVDPQTLEPIRTLAGAPLAVDGDDWRPGTIADGKPVWTTDAGTLVWGYAGGRHDFVIEPDGALRHDGVQLTSTGLGATSYAFEGTVYWIRTGQGPWSGPDEVQLGAQDQAIGEPVVFPSAVRATAIGRFPDRVWTLAVALAKDDRTALQAVRVVLP